MQGLDALRAKDWILSEDGTRLSKTFRFKTFKAAMAWMVRVADVAEDLNHHPDWSNSYTRVSVSLTTHDCGGLTDKDIALANAMEAALSGE